MIPSHAIYDRTATENQTGSCGEDKAPLSCLWRRQVQSWDRFHQSTAPGVAKPRFSSRWSAIPACSGNVQYLWSHSTSQRDNSWTGRLARSRTEQSTCRDGGTTSCQMSFLLTNHSDPRLSSSILLRSPSQSITLGGGW